MNKQNEQCSYCRLQPMIPYAEVKVFEARGSIGETVYFCGLACLIRWIFKKVEPKKRELVLRHNLRQVARDEKNR